MKYTEWRELDPCRHCDFNPRKRGFKDVCSSTKFANSCYSYDRYKSGIEAQRRLLGYLEEPCEEHDITEPFNWNYHYNLWTETGDVHRYQKRYYCDKCIAEIEKEIGI